MFVGFVAHLGACTREQSVPAAPQSKPDLLGTTLEAGRYFLKMPATFSEFDDSFAAPALIQPLASVVGSAPSCPRLQEIEASLDGVTLSLDTITLARGLEGPLFLRWRDELTNARAAALAGQGLEPKVSAICSENVEFWLCDGCSDTLSACAKLCALPGAMSEPTSAFASFPEQPVFRLGLDPGVEDRVARISIDVFDEPTP